MTSDHYTKPPGCRCAPTHLGRPIDLERFRVTPPRDERAPFSFIVVPGYTPRYGWPGGLHPKAVQRLELALEALERGLAPAVIVSGGAVHTRENEAMLMYAWLLERGIARERIVLEPCARHTTTNLRNAGRIVLSHGGREALVVTSDAGWLPRRSGWRFAEQAYYLGFPWLSTFHLRCMAALGHRVGELEWIDEHHVRFEPVNDVFRTSWLEALQGDP